MAVSPAWSNYATNLRSNRRFMWLIGTAFGLLVLLSLFSWSGRDWLSFREHFKSGNTHPAVLNHPVGARKGPHGRPAYAFLDGSLFEKPEGLKVVGYIFYGRWDRVQVLDCYMKRNLVKNGGMMDKVIWLENTNKETDIEALKGLLASESDYEHRFAKKVGGYSGLWDSLDADTMYIKLDDDIVYVADDAIPRLIQYRLENPRPFLVSANVINNPALSWVHTRLGAVRPWLPNLGAPTDVIDPLALITDWRVSNLPPITRVHHNESDFDINDTHGPQKWGPVEADDPQRPLMDANIDGTPAEHGRYDAMGPNWKDYRIAVQQHMSFFQNLEAGEKMMKRYRFDIWDMHYARLSINFLAIWGRDVHLALPMQPDDEQHLTQTVPKKLSRHAVFHGESIVAHYSFFTQYKGLITTDILERYRALAAETCGALLPLNREKQEISTEGEMGE
ncbi:hypothetical protein H2201_008829 [Coniosporium apollinis]|uniref:Glycosyl transferase CAP10 domain-containing protein n=2 Tax=Coniosporium TaxID=2810619 RepID=A0ABQ9NIQ7_9PEZI|nr:hypothetical protein H2199_006608 [Cladosporium sp. JES 115]KAJ9655309.1 hypothetical protein H2201_008829 [Coniosporium apollinis]